MRGWRVVLPGRVVFPGLALAAAAGSAGLAGAAPSAGAAPVTAGWHGKVLVHLGAAAANEVVSPARNAAFVLVTQQGGRFGLERIGLASHAVRRGRSFAVSQLSLAGGYLWVSGAVTTPSRFERAVLHQVSERTLRVVRSWTLTTRLAQSVTVAAGPAGTVWVGYGPNLRRISTRTGATVSAVRLGKGVQVIDVATDPGSRHLYASEMKLTRRGGVAVQEFGTRTGRLLAGNDGAPVDFAVGGAQLTAVPGGVWASFRTGMAGLTILLRQRGLTAVRLTGGRSLYGWFGHGSTGYGGGSVWAATAGDGHGGAVGCVAPATGAVRAVSTLRLLANSGQLLAVRASARQVIGLGNDVIIAITAPAACWR